MTRREQRRQVLQGVLGLESKQEKSEECQEKPRGTGANLSQTHFEMCHKTRDTSASSDNVKYSTNCLLQLLNQIGN